MSYKFLDFWEFDNGYHDIINDINKERIRAGIGDELSKKGFALDQDPDFYITFAGYFDSSNLFASTSIDGWGYWGPYYGPHWGPYGGAPNYQGTSGEGMLMIALVDVGTNQMVWYGAATGVLNNNEPEKTGKNIIKATQEIFKSFPVSSPEPYFRDKFKNDNVSPS